MPPTPGARSRCWPSPADCPPTAFRATATAGAALMQTSPTNIAAYLWSVLAAERLQLIGPEEATSRLAQTLATLAGMERTHGFFLERARPANRGRPEDLPGRLHPRPAAASPRWTTPGWRPRSRWSPTPSRRSATAPRLLGADGFPLLLRPLRPADPVAHPGQLRVGYRPDDQIVLRPLRHAQHRGADRQLPRHRAGQLPPEHYYRMFRTLPERLGPQEQTPQG